MRWKSVSESVSQNAFPYVTGKAGSKQLAREFGTFVPVSVLPGGIWIVVNARVGDEPLEKA